MKILQISTAPIHPDFGYGDTLLVITTGLGDDGKMYSWDEDEEKWVLMTNKKS